MREYSPKSRAGQHRTVTAGNEMKLESIGTLILLSTVNHKELPGDCLTSDFNLAKRTDQSWNQVYRVGVETGLWQELDQY